MNDICEDVKVTHCEFLNKPDITQKRHWKYFYRQALVCSGVWSTHFQVGLVCGTATVLIPQMRRESIVITPELESWISSLICFTGLGFAFILPTLAWFFGYRVTQSVVIMVTLIGYIVLYLSKTLDSVFIGLGLLGILGASISSVGLQIVTEYASPVNRGLFLSLQAATFYWGIWTSNAIGTLFDWRYIAVAGICCDIYNILTLFSWPESPYWLAARGQLEQTRNAFKWLRGKNQNKAELENLMHLKSSDEQQTTKSVTIKRFFKNITSKSFYKPMLLCALMITQYHFQGKLIMSVYAVNILKKITDSESKAYTAMLILDGVTILGMYLGSFLSRCLPRRVQLLAFAAGGIICLLNMSLYLFLVRKSIIFENAYVSILLLSIFSICVGIGPIMLSMPVCSELMPILLRNSATYLISFYVNLTTAISLKIGPQPFISWGIDGGFLFFGLSSIVFFILMYKYVPETKNKSIIEISDIVMGLKSDS